MSRLLHGDLAEVGRVVRAALEAVPPDDLVLVIAEGGIPPWTKLNNGQLRDRELGEELVEALARYGYAVVSERELEQLREKAK